MRILRSFPVAMLFLWFICSPVGVQGQTPGPSVNMVSGTGWTNGDPFLQRQNEPSLAVSTRNPLHLLGGANDYRSVDIAGLAGQSERADAWLGVFKSFDGGQTWQSTLLPGFPLDSSPAGIASPLQGFQAAADPTVRAGTNGLFYYSGIAFNRGTNAPGVVFVARFIDNDNKENGDATHTNGSLTNLAPTDPIQYLSTVIVDSGNSGQFLDKPWIATDVPRGTATCSVPFTKPDGSQGTQTVPAGQVYLAYTSFNGNLQDTKIMFSSSQDCGATWNKPVKLSESNSVNQGTIIVVDPSSASNAAATIYVAWRRFATSSQPDALMIAKSTDGGNTFDKAIQAVAFPATCSTTSPPPAGCPFDQGTTAASFRTSAFPALTVDDAGSVYLAWSQRQASGDARIMMQVSPDGLNWSSAPTIVDNGSVLDDNGNPFGNLSGHGHQLMPSLTFSAGKLSLVYFDFREDHTLGFFTENADRSSYTETREFQGELAANPNSDLVFNPFVSDAAPPLTTRRHTIDVQGAQASPPLPGGVLNFSPFRISHYLFGINPSDNPNQAEQLQVDAPDLPMFEQGTVPFFGDYIDVAAAPPFLLQGAKWVFNTNSANVPVLHAVWTDNRDVVPPPDGNWTHYEPPFSASNPEGSIHASIFDPTQMVTACHGGVNDGFVASRNQNIYTSIVAPGLVVGSQGNSKPLGFLPNNPTQLLQRAFTVTLRNTTTTERSFRISIGNQPALANGQPDPKGQASLLQFGLLTSLDVTIAAQSSIARALFIQSANPTASVTVTVQEITAPNGSLVFGGLAGFVTFNPDPSAPQILDPENFGFANPAILSAETHNPAIANPAIANPAIANPAIANPAIANPAIANPAIANPAIANPAVVAALNPAIANPAIANPAIANPAIANPAIANQSVTDATYQVSNAGNTTTSYAVKLFQKAPLPAGVNLQLMLTKQYLLPVAQGCNLLQQIQNIVVSNVPNPVFTSAGSLGDPDLPDPAVTNATLALEPGETGQIVIRANVSDPVVMQNLLGAFTPVVVAHPANTGFATPPATLAVLSSSLPDAVTGSLYNGQVSLFGGVAPYSVTVTNGSLPGGLSIDNTGLITGTPSVAGTFAFTIQVKDSSVQTSVSSQVLTIRVGMPLVITTTSLPAATISVPYSASLAATGGFGNQTWSLPSGVLPAGLSLSGAGVIIGITPATGGTFTFTVTVTDSSCLGSVSNCQPQTAAQTLTIVIDSTPPLIVPTITGILGLNGWYVGNVTVSWNATDPESGIASSSGCGATSITTDTAGLALTCSATNGAGLSSSNTVTVKRDATPPVISGSRTPAPNAAGWNNTNVTVSFACTDGLSGVALGFPTGGTTLAANTPLTGTTVSGVCLDVAGNTSSTSVGPVKIDETPPSVSIAAPANGGTYTLNAAVASNFTCLDTLSGIASCAGAVASGTNFNTSSIGTHTFTVTATDVAGNQTQTTSTYSVGYNFVGFLSPLSRAGSVTAPSFSGSTKQGSAVPLKWELLDSSGNVIGDLSSVTSIVACPSSGPTAAPGAPCVLLYSPTVGAKGNSAFRFSSPQFIFNWDTSSTIGTVAGFFTVEVQLSDGSPAKATTIQFK